MIDRFYLKSYLNNSKSFYYSLLFISPLFFIYELMCWIQYVNEIFSIRNSADIFFQNIIREIFNDLTPLILLFVIPFIFIYNRKKIFKINYVMSTFFIMLFETIFWTILFVILVGSFNTLLLSIVHDKIFIEQYYLALGAGIWEEYLFRVVIMFVLIYILNNILNYNYFFSAILSILISSVLFSLFHHLGPFGEVFIYSNFFLRTFAGIFLGLLYLLRGYGIVVYTHVFYDFFIISNSVITYKY